MFFGNFKFIIAFHGTSLFFELRCPLWTIQNSNKIASRKDFWLPWSFCKDTFQKILMQTILEKIRGILRGKIPLCGILCKEKNLPQIDYFSSPNWRFGIEMLHGRAKFENQEYRKEDCTGTPQNPSTRTTLGVRFSSVTPQKPKSSFGNEWPQRAKPAISKQLLWSHILTSSGKSWFPTVSPLDKVI